jgi:hypothetical protein
MRSKKRPIARQGSACGGIRRQAQFPTNFHIFRNFGGQFP